MNTDVKSNQELTLIVDGNIIKDLVNKKKKEENLSIEEMASQIEIARSSLYNAMKPSGRKMCKYVVDSIAKYFGVPMEQICASQNIPEFRRNMLKNYINKLKNPELSVFYSFFYPVMEEGKMLDEVLKTRMDSDTNSVDEINSIPSGKETDKKEEILAWIRECPEDKVEEYSKIFQQIHEIILDSFINVKEKMNQFGKKRLQMICNNLSECSLYFGDLWEKSVEGSIQYFSEGDGCYTITLNLPDELREEFELSDIGEIVLEGICEEEGSEAWENKIKSEIVNAFYSGSVEFSVFNEDAELKEDFMDFLDYNIYNWQLEKMVEIEDNPLSPERIKNIRYALSRLFVAMCWEGQYADIGRVMADKAFANEMFEKYKIDSPFKDA
jgi:hypothetical protein